MKLVIITYHFEFTEDIEKILDSLKISNYARFSMIEGKDSDGKHFGSKVFPGSSSVVHARVEDDNVSRLLEKLENFKQEEKSHQHITALVLAVEDSL